MESLFEWHDTLNSLWISWPEHAVRYKAHTAIFCWNLWAIYCHDFPEGLSWTFQQNKSKNKFKWLIYKQMAQFHIASHIKIACNFFGNIYILRQYVIWVRSLDDKEKNINFKEPPFLLSLLTWEKNIKSQGNTQLIQWIRWPSYIWHPHISATSCRHSLRLSTPLRSSEF